ncbi:alpha/beta hydrolase family protein [Chloroflexota bacterium]
MRDCQADYASSTFGGSELVSKYEEAPGDVFVPFLGGTPEKQPEIHRTASPINYVTKDDPPLLLIQGDLDLLSPYNQSEKMYQAYQHAGLEAMLIKVSGAGHGFRQATDSPISPSRDEINQIRLDFFIKHLLLNR